MTTRPMPAHAALLLLSCAALPAFLAIPPARLDREPPRATLRLSGELEGRLEPCGCASGQVGGLARRSYRNQQDRSYDFLVEGGDLCVDGGPLDELKLFTTLNILDDRRARYDAIGVGAGDLRLPFDVLEGYVQSFPELRFVASDLAADGEPGLPFVPFVDLAKDAHRVRIASLARATPVAEVAAARGIRLLEPTAAWQRALAGVADDALRVLLVHGSIDAARAAARELQPRPDLVVAIDATEHEPPRAPELVDGVPLVHPGIRGRFVVDVTIERGPDGPRVTDYEAIPLAGSGDRPDRFEDAEMRELVLAHRFEVRDDDTRARMAERRATATGARYTGNASCAGCHTDAFIAWQGSKHAHAWETLEKAAEDRYGWPVTHYPDCIACHTVGYGEVSGFVDPERTPELRGVGCEECHGPGSAHVDDPAAHPLGRIDQSTCRRCHDFEQSPTFDYEQRWKAIEHR
ncbi:MAG: hypothetical protein IPM29_19725 [Planctomycetes bacterium]|nr:hypothetical protein [Planctomycetota bacterium]